MITATKKELSRLLATLRHPRNGSTTYLVSTLGAALVALTWVLLRTPSSAPVVRQLTAYRADGSWSASVVRLPLSAFAPTAHLPVGGAILQVLVALSLAGAVLGWRQAVLVGMTFNIVATLVTRVVLAIPDGPAQTYPRLRHALDTGPSVVFVSLVVCALVAERCTLLATAFVGGLVLLGVLGGPLAAEEHLVGVALGLAFGLVARSGGFRSVARAQTIARRKSGRHDALEQPV